ncbi:MAG: SIMPL domain-containing protein [Pirellulaceae bacterium]|jgi:uncharacterized protein YggE|nr:SIMPL domain-containing protein [Pirellulaceae bacterium]MDP7015567.1 SIMPL domain-containing protein [Pirellulaceae bacterium]
MRADSVFQFAALVFAAIFAPSISRAQSADSYLNVNAVGTVQATPDMVEVRGVVFGTGEETSDAVTKYLAARQSAEESLKELKLPGLSVKGTGVQIGGAGVSPQQVFIPNQVPNIRKVNVSETLIIQLKGFEANKTSELLTTVMKVVDGGKEAGVRFVTPPSPYRPSTIPPFVTFRVSDTKKYNKLAYQAAIKNGKEKASELAELANVEIVRIRSVDETSVPTMVQSNPYQTQLPKHSSSSFSEVTFSVGLRLSFLVKPKE